MFQADLIDLKKNLVDFKMRVSLKWQNVAMFFYDKERSKNSTTVVQTSLKFSYFFHNTRGKLKSNNTFLSY